MEGLTTLLVLNLLCFPLLFLLLPSGAHLIVSSLTHSPFLPFPFLLPHPPSIPKIVTLVDRQPPPPILLLLLQSDPGAVNASIDNHSWDCISKIKPAKSELVDGQRPWKTHRLLLCFLSIQQNERERAELWVIFSKTMCCRALFICPKNRNGTPSSP